MPIMEHDRRLGRGVDAQMIAAGDALRRFMERIRRIIAVVLPTNGVVSEPAPRPAAPVPVQTGPIRKRRRAHLHKREVCSVK